MLTIRKQQIAVFQGLRRREFESRALAYLAREYPREFERQGEQAMRQLLRDTMEWTKPYGVNTEVGIVVCAELTICYGKGFQQRETWADHVLNYSELDPRAKVERLKGYALK